MSNGKDRILLTGATGYLGSRLLVAMRNAGYSVDSFARGDDPCLQVKATRPNIIVHCATCYGRNGETTEEIKSANITLPMRLAEAAADNGVQVFVNTDTILPSPTSFYATTKASFRDELTKASKIRTRINLQFEQFFGPDDSNSKFPTFLIRKLLSGAPTIPLTSGEQRRHFLYIDDAVDAFLTAIAAAPRLSPGFHNYQVSTDQSVSIREFATLAKRLANNTATQLAFGEIPYRSNELMNSQTDISAMRKLGWLPKVSLEKALRITIEKERLNEIPH